MHVAEKACDETYVQGGEAPRAARASCPQCQWNGGSPEVRRGRPCALTRRPNTLVSARRVTRVAAMQGPSSPNVAAELLAEIEELSESCERHVRDALGIGLDGEIETLPILDHYITISRDAVR